MTDILTVSLIDIDNWIHGRGKLFCVAKAKRTKAEPLTLNMYHFPMIENGYGLCNTFINKESFITNELWGMLIVPWRQTTEENND